MISSCVEGSVTTPWCWKVIKYISILIWHVTCKMNILRFPLESPTSYWEILGRKPDLVHDMQETPEGNIHASCSPVPLGKIYTPILFLLWYPEAHVKVTEHVGRWHYNFYIVIPSGCILPEYHWGENSVAIGLHQSVSIAMCLSL